MKYLVLSLKIILNCPKLGAHTMHEMTLRELQLFALDILKDVACFCNENDIKYSLYGGTLLGAIRHQGFIPWDDDIDVIMPRDDYNRFCKIYKSDKYRIVNRDNDKSFQFAYSHICDFDKTICYVRDPYSNKPTGVFIDVFPADGCPPDESEIVGFYKENQECFQMTNFIRRYMRSFLLEWKIYYNNLSPFHFLRHMAIYPFRKYYYLYIKNGKNRWIERLIKLNTTYQFGQTPYWGSFSCLYKHVVYHPIDSFKECIKCKFEDGDFAVMKGYDGYLKRVYGNYMELPPKEQQHPPLDGYYKFYWK